MQVYKLAIVLILTFHFALVVICFEPFSWSTVAIVGLGYTVYKTTYCTWNECCTEKEIPGDIDRLEETLNAKVYGQHLAKSIIIPALNSHWNERHEPSRALTLSLHGGAGVGKNYITKFIEEALFTLGSRSDHVHHFFGRIHFPEVSKVNSYQLELYDWVIQNITKCPKQIFVFDEVEKMPLTLFDILVPLMYVRDSRKAIFIFISNTGASQITEQLIRLRESGYDRHNVQLRDFDLILKGAFNEEDRFKPSRTIQGNLVDHYVPFLPMEMEHVRACIVDEFTTRGIRPSEGDILSILEHVEWGPAPENLYSKTGCKRISQKVALVAAQKYWR